MRIPCCLAVLAVLLSAPMHALAEGAEVSAEKRAAIDQLLETTGALQLGQQLSAAIIKELADTLRATHANVPQKALDVLPEVVDGVITENLPAFKELLIHIYDAHFTLQELQGLNDFYATELGRKLIQVLPVVLREGMAAGQQWGQALGPEVARRIKARFVKEGIAL